MSSLRSAWTFLTMACASGAPSEPVPTLQIVAPAEVALVEGQSAEVSVPGAPAPLVVKFSRILSDSRCPEHVQCVWAGEVAVLLTYSGEASGELSLTLPDSEGSPASGNAGRYRIVLLEVTPYPGHGAPRTPPNRVKLGVTVIP
ncbi:MAG: hypothetical protein ABR551_08290 [Gemmatimonadales bacterium]